MPTIPELENLANITFYRGDLHLNVWIRSILSQRRFNEGDEHVAAAELAKATISNAGSIQGELICPILRSHMPKVIHTMNYWKIRVLMQEGNLARNLGDPDYAEKQCYGPAQPLIDKIKVRNDKARDQDAFDRRVMTVIKPISSNDVEKIIRNAKEHNEPYGLLTAYHNVGYHYFRDGDYGTAEKNFHVIVLEAQNSNTIVSWWHKMAGWLGMGITLYAIDQNKYKEALYYCLKAEYVSAMLCLRVDVTRGISEKNSRASEIIVSLSRCAKDW